MISFITYMLNIDYIYRVCHGAAEIHLINLHIFFYSRKIIELLKNVYKAKSFLTEPKRSRPTLFRDYYTTLTAVKSTSPAPPSTLRTKSVIA